ncbi:MAG: NAD(P)-binding domain-containing protein [Deltaproteobacteria bacterium]|nr:NAD(P)-binding domain-containing protein [Deltaproteobacteria bacterium]
MKSVDGNHFEYIILGAGPAGLQLGYFLQKSGRDFCILEAEDYAGAFMETYPRHRMLISSNKCYTGYDDPEINLRFDWNSLISDDPELLFKNYSEEYFPDASHMVRYLRDYAARYELPIRCKTRIKKIDRQEGFTLESESGEVFTCQQLVIATGLFKPFLPEIKGIEHAEAYNDVSVDPADFRNQKVLILGKGNSGFETADNLIATTALIHVASPSPLNFAWKTHFVGHVRAVNNNFLDTYQLKSQNAVLDCEVREINKLEDGTYSVAVSYNHAQAETEEIHYDRVICCTGFRFDDSIFAPNARPELAIKDKFPKQTAEWECTNVPGMYIGGVLMQYRDYKKTTSGFIHGFRYNMQAMERIFSCKYHQEAWPSSPVQPTLDGAVDAIVQRLNLSSALWQQFGFLADVLQVTPDGQENRYYPEVPVDYLGEGRLDGCNDFYQITLEFGKVTGDPFSIVRYPDPKFADRSVFLHPVIRHYKEGELVGELHLLEDLFGEWKNPEAHIKPLATFLEKQASFVAVEPYLVRAPGA